MSAIREVKFLRELKHPNVIEVNQSLLPLAAHANTLLQLLDVFSNKANLNLVLEFLDTDLEAVIKDRDLIFQGADIKSWMLMTMKGLEFCHRNWVLHRVRRTLCRRWMELMLQALAGHEAEQLAHRARRDVEDCGFRFGEGVCRRGSQDDLPGGDEVRRSPAPRSEFQLTQPADGTVHRSSSSARVPTALESTIGRQAAFLPSSCCEYPTWLARAISSSSTRSSARSERLPRRNGRDVALPRPCVAP